MLERFGDVRMAAVRIGGIKEAQPMIVAIEEQVRKALDAESSLVGMMTATDGAGAHGEAAGLDARLTESHSIRSAELAREGGKSGCGPSEGSGVDPSRSSGAGRAMDKIAAFHAASCRCASGASLLPNGRAKGAIGYQAGRNALE